MQDHQLDPKTLYSRRVKFEFPEYEYKHDYIPGSPAYCFVYPLFEGILGIYPDFHILSAAWSANSLWEFSTIKEENISVFFFVEDKIWDLARIQLRNYGIPHYLILKWTAPERPQSFDGQWLSQSLYMVNQERLKDYDQVIMIDTDCFLTTRYRDRKLDMHKLVTGTRKNPQAYASYQILSNRRRTPKWDKYYNLSAEQGAERFKDICKKRFGVEVTDSFHILAILNSFYPNLLDPKFNEAVEKNARWIGSEEDFLAIFHDHFGEIEDLANCWNIKVANYWHQYQEYIAHTEFFFSHLRRDKIPTDNDVDYYFQNIGVWT